MTVIHGHTHQLLTNRIGNIDFHGMLSTAWPWPYAPEGLPKLTVQMNRPIRSIRNRRLRRRQRDVLADGLVDKVYNLWNRNPIEVTRGYLASNGQQGRAAGAQHDELLRRRDMMTHSALLLGLAALVLAAAASCRRRRRHGGPALRRPDQDHRRQERAEDARERPEDRRRSDGAVAARSTPTPTGSPTEREKHTIVEPADNKSADRPHAGPDRTAR